MEKDSLIKRYLVFILGLYFLAMGIVLIVHSALGTTPISSINYVLSLNLPLTLGAWTFITNMLMVLIQLWLIRGEYGTWKDVVEILLQIPLSFVFSAFIDLNMWLTAWLAYYRLSDVGHGFAGRMFGAVGRCST